MYYWTLYGIQHIHINLMLIHCTYYCNGEWIKMAVATLIFKIKLLLRSCSLCRLHTPRPWNRKYLCPEKGKFGGNRGFSHNCDRGSLYAITASKHFIAQGPLPGHWPKQPPVSAPCDCSHTLCWTEVCAENPVGHFTCFTDRQAGRQAGRQIYFYHDSR